MPRKIQGQKKTGRNLRRGPVKTLSVESAGIDDLAAVLSHCHLLFIAGT
jgi:hypothetical protein